MKAQYIVYGWTVSPYTQKVLAYLRFKDINHQNIAPSILKLAGGIRRKVGRPVMPVVTTPTGEWWQDSSEIIDNFEALFPEHQVIPGTPKQRIAANLLELHGDEWLCMPALHYRWRTPENYEFALKEFSRNSWPWGPAFIGRKIGDRLGKQMRSYLPKLGIEGEVIRGLETYTTNLLSLLETHLSEYDFLLGSKPCIGDFSIFGPLWAHLYRDPGTTRLFDNLPFLRRWMERLLASSPEPKGEFLNNDHIPETLEPVLSNILKEQFEYCRSVIESVNNYIASHPDVERVPRIVGESPFQMGGESGSRCQLTYVQWMTQRSLDAYRQVPETEKTTVNGWLARLGGKNFMETRIEHRLIRSHFKEVLQKNQEPDSKQLARSKAV